MKKKISIIFVGAGFVVLVLLPILLSSDFVLSKVLARINRQSKATLKVADCDIGWQKGLVCSDVDYSDPERGVHLTVDQVTGSQSLLALLAAPKNLGTVRMLHPVFTLSDQMQQPSHSSAAAPEAFGSDLMTDENKAPFWDTLAVALAVEEGRVNIQGQQGKASSLDGIFSGSSSLFAGTVEYNLQWLAGDGEGKLLVDGYVNLPARQQNIMDILVARMHLQVSNLQLAPLLTIAAQRTSAPSGTGLLNGELTVTGAGRDNLDVVGNLHCTDLGLTGGVFGEDHPWLQRLSILIDGSKNGQEGWQVTLLDVNGDPGKISVSGEYGRDTGKIQVTGSVQLPVLFTQFPHFFQVQQETLVTSGSVKFFTELTREDARQRIVTDAAVDSIKGTYRKRFFSWDKTVTLSLAAEKIGEEVSVEQLDLATSFLEASGKGNRSDFSLQAQADLGKASQELGKLFALQWTGSGKLSVQATSRLGDENQYDVEFQAESAGLSLLKGGQTILPEHPFRLKGRLSAPETWLQQQGTAQFQVDGSVWPGTFSLTAKDVQYPAPSISAGYGLTTQMNLGLLSDLLQKLEVLPQTTTLAGDLNLAVAGFLTKNQVVLRELDLRAGDFSLMQGGITVQEKNLVLQTKKPVQEDGIPVGVRKLLVIEDMDSLQGRGYGLSAFDRVKRQLLVRDIRLRSTLVDLDIDQLHVDDLQKPLQSWRAELQGQADLAGVSALLHNNSTLRPALQFSGQSRFVLSVDQQQTPYPVSFALFIPDCLFKMDEKTIVDGEEVNLSSRFDGLLTKGNLEIHLLEVVSPPLSLHAEGVLHRAEESRLILKGGQTVDFSAVSQLLETFTGKTVAMSGRRQEPFQLDIPLTKEGLKTARFSSVLWEDSMRWSGIDARQLSLPVTLENGALQAGVHGTLAGGRLDIDSTYLMTEEPPHVTMPPGTQVCTGVQLDRPLTEGVLEKIHPLFGVLTSPTGTVDARVDDFYWPVVAGGPQQARFTTVFDVSDVQLESRGVLREVLGLMKIDDQPLTLEESEITCTGEQGRISCTPVKILVADSEMTISGSVGMDQSLDYLLEVPVTERLVGREGFRVLEGTSIKVPLHGTVKDPNFNRNLITGAISDLAGQAAGKAIEKQVDKLLPDLLERLKL